MPQNMAHYDLLRAYPSDNDSGDATFLRSSTLPSIRTIELQISDGY
jgi:hypothetical protein